MFLCYFIAHLDWFELQVSSVFAHAVLKIEDESAPNGEQDMTPFSIDTDAFKHSYTLSKTFNFANPFRRLRWNDAFSFESKQLFSKIRREWLLFADLIYEGGVGYFDDYR
jgi:hypothetical protein